MENKCLEYCELFLVTVSASIVSDFGLETLIDKKRQRHGTTPDCGLKNGVAPVMSNLDQRCNVGYLAG